MAKYEQWLTAEGLGRVEAWARDGLEDKELAKAMGVSTSTFYVWVKKYSELSEALTRGRGGAREQIENAVYKRALGYTTTVKEPMKLRKRYYNEKVGKMEELEEVQEVSREVHVPPDVKAAMLWLTNRNRDRWAEHPEPTDTDGGEKVTVVMDV